MTRTMAKTDEEIADHYNDTEDLSGFSAEPDPVEVRRNVTISVRFSASEIESLRARAEEAGTKVTAFIRSAALDVHRPPPDVAALAEAAAAVEEHLHHLRESLGEVESPTRHAGKFELYQDKAGKYRFRLRAANGAIVAVGEAYESKQAAQAGIASMQRAAGRASIVEA